MGFDAFCKSAGFDNYYGKNEYPVETDFDGSWGIWDEPFLQYVANTMNAAPQPFLGAVFTLSSHHPYKVPDHYKNKFKKGPLEIQETIMYTDFALQKFFEKASSMPWFQNTLFVLTADHTSEAAQAFYKNRVGQFAIPIVIYDPQNKQSVKKAIVAQQTDIMPTILDMLNYPKPFIAFGGSLLRAEEPRFSISFLNGNYQIIQDGYALQTDHSFSEALYYFGQDSLLTQNLIQDKKIIAAKNDRLLKAVIQQYNNRLIENKLSIR
jgi:phosphoglycerol transferase MdoB-like AlkP superfamily enzyme